MEVGTRHDRLCDSFSTDIARAYRGVGDSGSAYYIDTFFFYADDLHSRGIM